MAQAEVDLSAKQAQVIATEEGFDPAELAPAVRAAGFVPPDADVGVEVTVVGTVAVEGAAAFIVLPNARWQLSGEQAAAVQDSARVRIQGTFLQDESKHPDQRQNPKVHLRVDSWEPASGP